MKIAHLITLLTITVVTIFASAQEKPTDYLSKKWKEVATKMPSQWYGSHEAQLIAENVLLAQKEIGGWEKNKSYHHKFNEKDQEHYLKDKSEIGATFDNDATITELRFLAKVFSHTKNESYKKAFEKGLNYIFNAQYENGGWPQFFPIRKGNVSYSAHITYNDNAMVNTMKFLKEIYLDNKEYASLQIQNDIKTKAQKAYNKGIECLLKTQIVVNGNPTVWCAQHDEITLAPANARSYELASFSGGESVGIVLLLMEVEKPSKEIIASINGAIKWFESHKIEGIKLERVTNAEGLNDRIVVKDKNASTLWARFYDLDTEKPYFCDRDGIKKNTFAEIGHNRRNGYSWFTNGPEKALKEYSEWKLSH
ncbi:pectate lyase [Mariniflexile litorale]|uniref:Pectate lyase n=1 Tax=Mariniflexile litorale TaxID=3045158 RepID=A0AAU7EGS9_9FLAO|nr:pectate lyase [Mariniflexile sp. KMM 9835]MDQ8211742.1 pectate lyase [Mariniflexile sp. KMM 9835]